MFIIKHLLFLCFISTGYANTLNNFNSDNLKENTNEYWLDHGREEIQRSLKLELGKRVNNVILFLGDGMGVSTVTAARILKGQMNNKSGEEGYLFFERHLPNTALIKTYNVDRLVPDSAGTATCYLSGVKSNYEVIGVNAKISSGDLDCKKIQANHVTSIMEMARVAGKAIGVVTTTRITHATPAASYAHTSHRDFESFLPPQTKAAGCKDIATQLIEQEPGMSFNVILGGGRKHFYPTPKGSRTDNVDLIAKWKKIKKDQKLTEKEYKYIENVNELNAINPNEVKHLFGLFNESHLTYNSSLPTANRNEPTLREMTDMAVKILSKFKNGFVLLVEGGRIDLASHANNAYQALHEAVHFDETIESATKLINEKETLVLVTADHSHTLVINGYPKRGTNIFGFSDKTEQDDNFKETGKPFTILSYGSGPGNHYNQTRPDPREQPELGTNKYINYASVHLEDSSHGGEDVVIYSNSWPNLVRGVKEQNVVAHIMAYTSCIGQYTKEPHCLFISSAEALVTSSSSKTWIYAAVGLVAIVCLALYSKKLCFKKRDNII